MTKPGKDSPEVIKFMTLFARLKHWSDDAPDELEELADNDDSIKALTGEVYLTAWVLKEYEFRGRSLFAAPVDPKFLDAWRDFEDRYADVVGRVQWSGITIDLGDEFETPVEKPPQGDEKSAADIAWDDADHWAEDDAAAIEYAIEFSRNKLYTSAIDNAEYLAILNGLEALDGLVRFAGLDYQGILRRRALIPFVLVPRRVAATSGSAEKLSLLKNLQHAHDAFVFGATYAALALMRSIMEAVLRDHYRADGKDLDERIWHARARLPSGANAAALHRLRKLANAILHLDREKGEGLPSMNKMRLEKEIVSLLFVLRALIEGAK